MRSSTETKSKSQRRRNPRRGDLKQAPAYAHDNDAAEGESGSEGGSDAVPSSPPSTDDDELGNDEMEYEQLRASRRSRRKKNEEVDDEVEDSLTRRTSSRRNKCTRSMAEPTGMTDLYEESTKKSAMGKNRRPERDSLASLEEVVSSSDTGNGEDDESKQAVRGKEVPKKNAKVRKSKKVAKSKQSENDDQNEMEVDEDEEEETDLYEADEGVEKEEADGGGEDDVDEDDEDDDEGDDEDPPKIQKILATRSESRLKWRDICAKMNTSEVTTGSRWFQQNTDAEDDSSFEERFLVKWTGLSFLHCSWESEKDLLEETENAKTYIKTFFRKSFGGYLLSPEERCDGDYFDPAYTQVDRILSVEWPEGYEPHSHEMEDQFGDRDFGVVLDVFDKGFKRGSGRHFLVKWVNLPYTDATIEYERDLILREVEYKEHVKDFLRRREKPTKSARKCEIEKCDSQRRKVYTIFGDNSKKSEEQRLHDVKVYQEKLAAYVYKNGGQLRDYQAEGVSWTIGNYVNKRSCILADEMGLGKTLQTAATLKVVSEELSPTACFLVVAPLSTLAHWRREVERWTNLNAIVYHGTAENRAFIREYEMVYEDNRPKRAHSWRNYLRQCMRRAKSSKESPWMVDVVITSPEMLVTDDASELMAIKWEALVVDEAHRLKNHNSKLAVMLRNDGFHFNYKLLLTGTPLQNSMQELWTLLNFIDRTSFSNVDEFMEKYGDMKDKETVDELHNELRPYILRRLKEDVEKEMPPKEETIIEVELTVYQKQYYRALYEKNVKFLHKNKSKALDGPSLTNLAMQLRKCCNHVFLLNGIEDEVRKKKKKDSEADFLVSGSGKLVLLDKLLPRLKEEGHRVLVFSQFKIMLDIIEDYLSCRHFSYDRIDGSITGLKRQLAIDRFQGHKATEKEPPFVMMLSTRAGGVGINLTAADTVIIFDSDWNPQNDLQAQARCHRIGQEKSVKVYRLLSARTYEMNMFNLASLKMGLDQAVLKGFEGGASDGSMSKEQVEKLLRHGAYALISEEKAGNSEAKSNEFVQQDIDSILARRTRTIVHKTTENKEGKGSTFSKASFKVTKTPDKTTDETPDVEIDDPDFWKKMLGESHEDEDNENLERKDRRRQNLNYSEDRREPFEAENIPDSDDEEDDDDDSYDSGEEAVGERFSWGGTRAEEWSMQDAQKVEELMLIWGYGILPWEEFVRRLGLQSKGVQEVRRMAWSIVMALLLEETDAEARQMEKRAGKAAEKEMDAAMRNAGGVLGAQNGLIAKPTVPSRDELTKAAYFKLASSIQSTYSRVISDAVEFASGRVPRDQRAVSKALDIDQDDDADTNHALIFAKNVWQSLKTRGWQAVTVTEGAHTGQTAYGFMGQWFYSIQDTVRYAKSVHPELTLVLDNVVEAMHKAYTRTQGFREQVRQQHLAMNAQNTSFELLVDFFRCYAPMQFFYDRKHSRKIACSRKLLSACSLMSHVVDFLAKATSTRTQEDLVDILTPLMPRSDKRRALPHPQWTLRQDVALVIALSRFGLFEPEHAWLAMRNDTSILWGMPFDSLPPRSPAREQCGKAKLDSIVSEAGVAAAFLQVNWKTLEESKTFSFGSVVEGFCLIAKSTDDAASEMIHLQHEYNVNEKLLRTRFASKYLPEPIPLPPKKEILKQVKWLIPRLSSSPKSHAPEPTQTKGPSVVNGFTLIDKSDAANLLLVELVSALIRQPTPSISCKKLCQLTIAVAKLRVEETGRLKEQHPDPDGLFARECASLREITKHIEFVQRSFNQPIRLWKNVLRVILGATAFGTEAEGLFPKEIVVKPVQTAVLKKKPDVVPLPSTHTGYRVILDAENRQLRSNLKPNGGTPSQNSMHLTQVETLILETASSFGIPLSTSKNGGEEANYFMWREFGALLEKTAECAVHSSHLKHSNENNFDESCDSSKENRDIMPTFQGRVSYNVGYEQAKEYSADPEILAKKATMILAKLVKKAGVGSPSWKTDVSSGSNISKWLSQQVTCWAEKLQLVDQNGDPHALTAVDFLDSISESDQHEIQLVSCFDKHHCRDILGQIATVARLRSVVLKWHGDAFCARVEQAAIDLRNRGNGEWMLHRPENWSSTNDDLLLLKRLVAAGFVGLSEQEENWKIQSVYSKASYKDAGLRLGLLQLRVNELTKALHLIEESVTDKKNLLPEKKSGRASLLPLVDLTESDDDLPPGSFVRDVEVSDLSPLKRKSSSDSGGSMGKKSRSG